MMSYAKPESAGRNVHLTSAAPRSMNLAYDKILQSVKSSSVPRGYWSKSTAIGAGPSYPTTIWRETLQECSFSRPIL